MPDSREIAAEAARRRTFAIVSHPDAGKTTLTEKLLLFGGAIQIAGAVRARKASRHAISDWMKMEQERGISVTTSVMSFPFPLPGAPAGAPPAQINLLDTPGHADFGEDTYRVLTAVDSVLMVIDGAKGVEERTEKLIDICRMRDTPVVTFVNKLDRECRPALELMDEIEKKLGIPCVPITWPIGMGKRFRGVYELSARRVHVFRARADRLDEDVTELHEGIAVTGLSDPHLDELVGDQAADLRSEIELVQGAAPEWDHAAFLAGRQTPLLFGSAMNNFGVRELLRTFVAVAPPPRARDAVAGAAAGQSPAPAVEEATRTVEPTQEAFTGFVFKIQANMDPNHRDRIAFLRVCSGRFERGMKAFSCRLGRELNVGNATMFMARTRELIESAYPGDIVGIPNHGTIKIGDTFTQGELLRYRGIPSFAPEIFRRVVLKTPLKAKALAKGLTQLAEEGAIQVFRPLAGTGFVVGAVGELQLEVMKHRLFHEYAVEADYESVDLYTARWVTPAPEETDKREADRLLAEFRLRCEAGVYADGHGDLAYLASSRWNLEKVVERFPRLRFSATREHS